MSVIIEGLTLPKHNPKEIDKNVLIGYAIVKEDNTAELCLEGVHYLIKMLPTPHGTLIDKEVAIETFKEVYCGHCKKEIPCFVCSVPIALDVLNDIPTIIEAEVSE